MPPAARVTDMHVCPMVTGLVPHVGGPILPPGAPTVLIDFLPAATVTSMATCVGPPDVIVMGSTGVMINFLPAARLGDPTAHGGVIVMGSPTCIIGEVGTPSPGAGGLGGIVAGMAVSGTSQIQKTPSKYSTAEKAAIAAMKEGNPKSVKDGREYGGWVRKNDDGTFSYDPPVKGSKDGLTNMPSKGASDVVWYHTHGAPDPGYDNENFSGATGDKGYSAANNAIGYLATPSGTIKKYDPASDSVTTLLDTAKP